MSDMITLTGIVATPPRHLVTTSGIAITSFRLASGQRRFDRAKNAWVDAETNWYTVSTFRHLAMNVLESVQKGQHVLVTGRLRVRNWEIPERKGTSIEVEAESVGHDLLWCTTAAVRKAPTRATAPGLPGQEEPAQDAPSDTRTEDGWFHEESPGSGDGFLPTEPDGQLAPERNLATLDS